jgi:hypothetical protein
MRSRWTSILATLVACFCFAAAASAQQVRPRSAGAFQDSVGLTTHIVYYDTPYGDWPRIVSKLVELGVKHLRDGVYANPALQWRDWNQRYYDAVEVAAAQGIKFDLGMGQPGFGAGTLDQLAAVVRGRLRGAVEAVEDPNEFDLFGGIAGWPQTLVAYDRSLYQTVKSDRTLRTLPVVGPSFGTYDAPQQIGNQARWLDIGNIHPYTGGQSPSAAHTESELLRAALTAPGKPVWATEAGFNNAVHAADSSAEQPAVPERVAADYTLTTLLEHFKNGIARTYLYELIDEHPDPGQSAPQQDYGLLRNDFSPKPAYTALQNLLRLVGQGAPEGWLHPLDSVLPADTPRLRHLVLQRDDGTYVVALWSLASAWNTAARQPVRVPRQSVTVALPAAASAAIANPVTAAAARPMALRRGRVRVRVGRDPIILLVTQRPAATRRRSARRHLTRH